MKTLLLSPHNDDETLFAGFLVMRFRPKVHVVFKSTKQDGDGISAVERETETQYALAHLIRDDFEWEQGEWPDVMPQASAAQHRIIDSIMEKLVGCADEYDHCFAPAWEPGGHEGHNLVAGLAVEAFGEDRVTQYLTYRRGYGRSTSDWPVPFEPWWPVAKLRAMSCYSTQITLPATQPWFVDGTLREYLAHEPKIPWPLAPGTRAILPLDHHERAAYL